MIIDAFDPGWPLVVIFTPEVSPRIDSTTLLDARSAKTSSLIDETAPSKSFFLTVPYPIATTSSRPIVPSSITTSITVLEETAISCVFIPTNENTMV